MQKLTLCRVMATMFGLFTFAFSQKIEDRVCRGMKQTINIKQYQVHEDGRWSVNKCGVSTLPAWHLKFAT